MKNREPEEQEEVEVNHLNVFIDTEEGGDQGEIL